MACGACVLVGWGGSRRGKRSLGARLCGSFGCELGVLRVVHVVLGIVVTGVGASLASLAGETGELGV